MFARFLEMTIKPEKKTEYINKISSPSGVRTKMGRGR